MNTLAKAQIYGQLCRQEVMRKLSIQKALSYHRLLEAGEEFPRDIMTRADFILYMEAMYKGGERL